MVFSERGGISRWWNQNAGISSVGEAPSARRRIRSKRGTSAGAAGATRRPRLDFRPAVLRLLTCIRLCSSTSSHQLLSFFTSLTLALAASGLCALPINSPTGLCSRSPAPGSPWLGICGLGYSDRSAASPTQQPPLLRVPLKTFTGLIEESR